MSKSEIRINTEMRNPKPSFEFRHSNLIRVSDFVIRVFALCLSAFICGSIISCDKGTAADTKSVVLYTSIDEPIARPIIEAFEKTHGVKVTLVTDTEANKSVGLAEKLRAEKDRPRADVWWGNEPFHTINLAEEGLFAAYESPSAADVPAMFRDAKHRWAGNGLRARYLVFRVGDMGADAANAIVKIDDLVQERFKDKSLIARPGAGTTGGHVAALYSVRGQEQADLLFRRLHANGIKLVGGNSNVAQAVANGDALAGITDIDDYQASLDLPNAPGTVGKPLDPKGEGTLMIPTTVALVANRPANTNANKLIDYLLSKEVEQKLIEAQFAGWTIREEHRRDADATSGQPNTSARPKAMQVDYTEVAKKMPEAVRRATAILEGREP